MIHSLDTWFGHLSKTISGDPRSIDSAWPISRPQTVGPTSRKFDGAINELCDPIIAQHDGRVGNVCEQSGTTSPAAPNGRERIMEVFDGILG